VIFNKSLDIEELYLPSSIRPSILPIKSCHLKFFAFITEPIFSGPKYLEKISEIKVVLPVFDTPYINKVDFLLNISLCIGLII